MDASAGHLSRPVEDSGKPAGKSFFFWFTIVVGAGLAFAYSYTGWMLCRYSPVTDFKGWSTDWHNGQWFVGTVHPHGLADGKLEAGDRVLAVNGDVRAAKTGLRAFEHF